MNTFAMPRRAFYGIRGIASLVVLLLPLTARAQHPLPAGGEFRVNTFTPGYQGGSAVARQPDGHFLVVWGSQDQDGSGVGAFGRIYAADGGTLGNEFRVNTYTTGYQILPRAAAAANGEFVVVWGSDLQDGSLTGIFGQRISSTGMPLGAEFRVNAYTTGKQLWHHVAASASGGNFVVTWTSYHDANQSDVYAQCFDALGAPDGPQFRVNSYTTGGQDQSDVAMRPDGSFAVVWNDASRGNTYGRRFGADCTASGTEFQAHSGFLSAIAMDAGGNFVVAGIESSAGGYDIFAQRFNSAGSALGTQFRVNTYTPEWQIWPAIAMAPGGDFVVSWETYNQTTKEFEDISARYIRADGTPAGAEFRVNTYTTGTQYRSAAGMDAGGNFVVTWSSTDGNEFNSTDVYAQRFDDRIFENGFNAGP